MAVACECIATRGGRTPRQSFSALTYIRSVLSLKLVNHWTCPLLSYSVLVLLLIRRVTHTLWPWPLIPWPWSFAVNGVSCDQTMYNIWAKCNNLRVSHWRFSYCYQVADFQTQIFRRGWSNCSKCGLKRVTIIAAPDAKLWYRLWLQLFRNANGSKKSGAKDRGQILHFLTP